MFGQRGPAGGGRPASAVRGSERLVPLESNLRGVTVAEAVDALDRYLDEALWAGVPWAHIALGQDTGTLCRAVQDLGDGVTIVELNDG